MRQLQNSKLTIKFSNLFAFSALLSLVSCGLGCTPNPEFRANNVEFEIQRRSLGKDEQLPSHFRNDIENMVGRLFGTPDEPTFPYADEDEDPAHELMDQTKLTNAAGAVSSERDGTHTGLYREHCAQCHGITGDGKGPTSGFLNPYPRDFRHGRYKFKSTTGRSPPTHDDLERIIKQGIPGTAMPSFKLLKDEEIDSLISYVRYLSMRGQFERALINQIGDYIGDDERLLNWPNDMSSPDDEKELESPDTIDEQIQYYLDELYQPALETWLEAEDSVSDVPSPPKSFPGDSILIDQGKQLFFGKGGCAQCHGSTGLGDGQTANHDLWTLTWLETPGVSKDDWKTYQSFIDVGAFPPRTMKPRNLRLKVFRGGNRPDDVYRRIANGIDGTPMPAASALEPDEIWALVAYLLQLPDESISGGSISNNSGADR